MATIEQEIKEAALAGGAQVAGVASVEAINQFAPEGYRPEDILAGARSVIVTGGPVLFAGAWRSPSSRMRAIARNYANVRKGGLVKLTSLIETRYGHLAIPYDGETETNFVPFMSLKLCAEMAGLGTRSMAGGIVLNGEHGLLNFGAVVTTLPLAPDGPLEVPVCPHSSCVKLWEQNRPLPCLEACPTCLSGELENGRIKRMQFRRQLCAPFAQTTSTAAFQRLLLEIVEEPDPGRRKALALGSFFGRVVRTLGSGTELAGNCFECVRLCPVCLAGRSRQRRL